MKTIASLSRKHFITSELDPKLHFKSLARSLEYFATAILSVDAQVQSADPDCAIARSNNPSNKKKN